MVARIKKIGGVLLLSSASLLLAWYAVNSVWQASGSSEWELEIDRDGVKVYSYKAPGSYTKQYKGVVQGDYTITQIVASLTLDNDSLENCKRWIPPCIGVEVLEPYSHKAQGDSVLWTLELMPPVFANREYLIKTQVDQNPKTKVATVDVMAGGNKLPPQDCCVRIKHIHNRWQLTPLDNGKLEVQLIQDFSMGGFFPDFLLNFGGAEETYKLLHDQLPGLVDRPKYRNASFPYIDEAI